MADDGKLAAFLPVTAEQLWDRPTILRYLADRLPDVRQRLDPLADDADLPPDSSGDET